MMIAKRNTLLKYLFIACLSLSNNSIHALGKVSRACPVADIPAGLKTAALQFFEAIGDAPMGSLPQLALLPAPEQAKFYILESLTTDYLQARYYLYAENRIRRTYIPFNIFQNVVITDFTYKSTWIASSLANSTLTDPRFNIFLANRQALYSARAGNSNIVEFFPIDNNVARQDFEVVGRHYYRDPTNNMQSYLGVSKARNCNLLDWGFTLADR
jgi:hypothetical protein